MGNNNVYGLNNLALCISLFFGIVVLITYLTYCSILNNISFALNSGIKHIFPMFNGYIVVIFFIWLWGQCIGKNIIKPVMWFIGLVFFSTLMYSPKLFLILLLKCLSEKNIVLFFCCMLIYISLFGLIMYSFVKIKKNRR